MPTVLYCHGFLSSPQSTKAQLVKRWFAKHKPSWHYLCPELSAHPSDAKAKLQDLVKGALLSDDEIYCVGSSLGGYWATWLSECYGFKSVLVNPAVAPHTRFTHFVGQALKSYYSEDVYTLGLEDLKHLKENDSPVIKDASLYYVLLQAGDETLDYRQAVERYQGGSMVVEPGGNHSFEGFESYLPKIVHFFEGE